MNDPKELDKASPEELRQMILALQKELEKTKTEIKALTLELEVTNREFETFSYSISHDLRTPLRHIEGFAQLLAKGYLDHLPAKGQDLLRNVTDRSKYMGLLISKLTDLSRVGSHAVEKQRVSLGETVRKALAELAGEHTGRQVDIRVGDMPDCSGDPDLLKQVFLNLLSNAFKFTRTRDQALVEIICEPGAKPGELLCTIRDNGVGFDMEYAVKLFGVFQRMHRVSDFEGTGIGLSIARRIIRRHGGKIWAEAAVDKGASFFFTLPVA